MACLVEDCDPVPAPQRIPSRCRHWHSEKRHDQLLISDFSCLIWNTYEHVDAHQDKDKDYVLLKQPTQMSVYVTAWLKG